jgi:hypothetical protein
MPFSKWRERRRSDPSATKIKFRAAWATGDRIGALRIAAQFFDRSGATKTLLCVPG